MVKCQRKSFEESLRKFRAFCDAPIPVGKQILEAEKKMHEFQKICCSRWIIENKMRTKKKDNDIHN